jgi:hypothetical protein
MRLIEFDLRPSPSRLRQFGLAAAVFCALLALTVQWRGRLLFWEVTPGNATTLAWLGGIGAAVAVASWIRPRVLWPIYVGLALIAVPVGTVVSYTLLALIFYGLLTPLGLWFRARGRDPLARRGEDSRDSYWQEPRHRRDARSYFRQF